MVASLWHDCFKRLGAFEMLIHYNASRVSSSLIAVEDLDSVLFVTNSLQDPLQDTYDYDNPCPDTPTRVANYNALRTRAGGTLFTGVPNLSARLESEQK